MDHHTTSRVLVLSALCFNAGIGAPLSGQQEPLSCYWSQVSSAQPSGCPPVSGSDSVVASGLARLRAYEQTGDRTDAWEAVADLEQLIRRGEADAWTHFALGALLARGPHTRIVLGDDRDAYTVMAESNAAVRAPRELRRALELDPTLYEAAYVFARLALDLGDMSLLQEALEVLVTDGRATDAMALQLRAQIHAQLGQLAAAGAVADSARLRGGDAALAAHIRAEALLRRRDTEARGAEAYFDGVAALTQDAAAIYFGAVRTIVSDRDAREWQAAATLEQKRAWLHRFWQVQSAMSGVKVHERLGEHFRRHAAVFRGGRTACVGSGNNRGTDAPRDRTPADEYAALQNPGSGMNALWAQEVPDGCSRSLTSMSKDARSFGVPDIESLLLLRHGDPQLVRRVQFCGTEVLAIPAPLRPSIAACLQTPEGRMRARRASETRLHAFLAEDISRPGNSYYPPYNVHLQVVHEMLQFRGIVGTDLVAALALPTASARHLVDSAGTFSATIDMFVIDTVSARVQSHETRRRFAAGTLAAEGWVLLNSQLPARPAAAQQYRVAVTNDLRDKGRIVSGAVDVRDYSGGALALSDVLVTPLDATPSFARGDVMLSLAPARAYARHEQFRLYYEVYGLPTETPYRTELTIEPVPGSITERLRMRFRGAPESIRLSFEDVAGAARAQYGVQEVREVDVAGLTPGEYNLVVKVTDLRTRESASRAARLVVVE